MRIVCSSWRGVSAAVSGFACPFSWRGTLSTRWGGRRPRRCRATWSRLASSIWRAPGAVPPGCCRGSATSARGPRDDRRRTDPDRGRAALARRGTPRDPGAGLAQGRALRADRRRQRFGRRPDRVGSRSVERPRAGTRPQPGVRSGGEPRCDGGRRRSDPDPEHGCRPGTGGTGHPGRRHGEPSRRRRSRAPAARSGRCRPGRLAASAAADASHPGRLLLFRRARAAAGAGFRHTRRTARGLRAAAPPFRVRERGRHGRTLLARLVRGRRPGAPARRPGRTDPLLAGRRLPPRARRFGAEAGLRRVPCRVLPQPGPLRPQAPRWRRGSAAARRAGWRGPAPHRPVAASLSATGSRPRRGVLRVVAAGCGGCWQLEGAVSSLAICTVTWNDAANLPRFFEALATLQGPAFRLIVVDNASTDGTVESLREHAGAAGFPVEVIAIDENTGFAGGLNRALESAFASDPRPEWVLSLNADAWPAADYLEQLIESARRFASEERPVGAVTGRLVRPESRLIDACGMALTRSWRHVDRGSDQADHGQYAVTERVFGGTGAATLFLGAALQDVAIDGHVLDDDFHSYREDAELCFRLQERGWQVLYEPRARAVHRRVNLARRRRGMSPEVNFHSLKNRYLLQYYHRGLADLPRTFLATAIRELGIVAYVLLRERSSLAAWGWLWRHRRRLRERRRLIRSRRLVPARETARWFGRASLPVDPERPRILMLGSRGIPANYSGYETMIEALAPRLAERGWRVTVYCRSHYVNRRLRSHRGVELVVLPTLRTKYGDTPVHTLLSCLHAILFARGARAALVVNGANAVFLPLLWPRRIRTALHVDGIEKRRAKWGWPGRLVYSVSERLACLLPGVTVTDAEVIAAHYRARYRRDSTMIRYGVEPEPLPGHPILDELGLEPRRYFLYVSRFEPENNPHRVVEAYRRVDGDLPLVMVGDAPYASDFIAGMKRGADPRVRFPGTVFGEGYRGLLSSALATVHATEVGGTHPALVEAMGYGNCVLVNDEPANRETAGDAGVYFDVEDQASLVAAFEFARADGARARDLGERAALRAAEEYNWDVVADEYEQLFRLLSNRGRRRTQSPPR
ncbi:MAG: glycosyltransferase [Holophagales bacterium]|nr:glycosyltransferase [Holophagales bacterium]MYC09093.1 glycosyltransferase [Holophagales bacterium]